MNPKVKTHRIIIRDANYQCEFCERDATYWSQVSNGEKCLSRCVWHCQAHRDKGRTKAVSMVRLFPLHKFAIMLKFWVGGLQ